VENRARNVEKSWKVGKISGHSFFCRRTFPHFRSERSISATFPHFLWKSFPHFPQKKRQIGRLPVIHTQCGQLFHIWPKSVDRLWISQKGYPQFVDNFIHMLWITPKKSLEEPEKI
jgi:hypothetical protein